MEKFNFGESASNSLVGVIREAIISGRLETGTLISTSTLAEQFGVSRTPVREALLQLSQAGMVEFEKNRGVRILKTSIADLIEVFQVRLLTEVPLAARAAEIATDEHIDRIEALLDTMKTTAKERDYDAFLRADRDFHIRILEIVNITRVVDIVRNLRNVVLTRGVGTVPYSRPSEQIIIEHEAILSGLKVRNAAETGEAMKQHILNTAQLLINQEGEATPDFDPSTVLEYLNWVHK